MKHPLLKIVSTAFVALSIAPAAQALSGDTKLACEAVLCLSSSTRPSECTPSLSKYFGIKDKRPDRMITKRLNFLKLCPAGSAPKMPELLAAISQGAGRCDAKLLNQFNKKTIMKYVDVKYRDDNGWWKTEKVLKEVEVISSKAPNYCAIYENHDFTEMVTAKYVGDEAEGGYWVDPSDYDRALQQYQDNLQPKNNTRPWFRQ